jgi:hypothetical protein
MLHERRGARAPVPRVPSSSSMSRSLASSAMSTSAMQTTCGAGRGVA